MKDDRHASFQQSDKVLALMGAVIIGLLSFLILRITFHTIKEMKVSAIDI